MPSHIHASFGSTKRTRGVKPTPCPSRRHLSRRDRSPCPHPTPPSLHAVVSDPTLVTLFDARESKLTLNLLLLGLLSGGSATSSSTAGRGGGSGTTALADGGEEVLHVLALKSLQCNKKVPVSRPVRFRFSSSDRELIANSCMLFGYSYLGEKRGPDRLNIDDVGGLDEGLDLVGLDCKVSFSATPLNCSAPRRGFARRNGQGCCSQ